MKLILDIGALKVLNKMRLKKLFIIFTISTSLNFVAKADFGDADFTPSLLKDRTESYHDAFCREHGNECRVLFQGDIMSVEGQGSINSSQYIGYRQELTGGMYYNYYNYISYLSKEGIEKEALFLFTNTKSQREFIKAFFKWRNTAKK